jgi:hypothetical protein
MRIHGDRKAVVDFRRENQLGLQFWQLQLSDGNVSAGVGQEYRLQERVFVELAGAAITERDYRCRRKTLDILDRAGVSRAQGKVD